MERQEAGAVSTTAVGSAQGAPDRVELVLGVETQAENPGAALQDALRQATELVGVLDHEGVAGPDRQTVQLGVTPTFDHQGQVVAHHATYLVRLTIPDDGHIAQILTAATDALGSVLRVQGVRFLLGEPTSLMATARARAMRAALEQARQLVGAAGATLGPVRSIVEGTAPSAQPFLGASIASSTPLEAGTSELSVVVTVTYDMVVQEPGPQEET